MFGTAVAVMDGYARASERIIELLYLEDKNIELENRKKEYVISISILSIVSFFIGYFYVFNSETADINGFKGLVDIATTTSFIVAPIIAVINFILVQKKYVGKDFEPPLWKKILSYAGIVFLTAFSIFYFFI
jgi:Mn2+/Fe2+ NRAMP family transporter